MQIRVDLGARLGFEEHFPLILFEDPYFHLTLKKLSDFLEEIVVAAVVVVGTLDQVMIALSSDQTLGVNVFVPAPELELLHGRGVAVVIVVLEFGFGLHH